MMAVESVVDSLILHMSGTSATSDSDRNTSWVSGQKAGWLWNKLGPRGVDAEPCEATQACSKVICLIHTNRCEYVDACLYIRIYTHVSTCLYTYMYTYHDNFK